MQGRQPGGGASEGSVSNDSISREGKRTVLSQDPLRHGSNTDSSPHSQSLVQRPAVEPNSL